MNQIKNKIMFLEGKEIRCPKCDGLLMKGEIKAIEIKCRKCHNIVRIVEEEPVTV